MIEITGDTLQTTALTLFVLVCVQLIAIFIMGNTLRSTSREQQQLNKEMFGLLKKIEGLTAQRRELMLKHYDKILQNLSTRLPTTIASKAGDTIFEAESKILKRLAELEPNLKEDENSQKKMDDLIKSMENLESTIIALTADTVQSVMAEGRKDLFEDEYFVGSEVAH